MNEQQGWLIRILAMSAAERYSLSQCCGLPSLWLIVPFTKDIPFNSPQDKSRLPVKVKMGAKEVVEKGRNNSDALNTKMATPI